MSENITRPIIGIENRTAQEVFDIMVARIGASPAPLPKLVAEVLMVDMDAPLTAVDRLRALAGGSRDIAFEPSDADEILEKLEALAAILSAPNLEFGDEPAPAELSMGAWLPIDRADKEITNVEDFSEVGVVIRTSDRYWVRDDDGRVYEAAWSEGENGRNYWWDFEGESPVDPVEFMPHPLDPRFHTDAKLEDQP